MKSTLLSLFVLSLLLSCTPEPNRLKVACVGNSITRGAGMAHRKRNNYPMQLQYLLGEGYEVGNFGISGATLLRKGDRPYWETDGYEEALAFEADIVCIMLGTNDSKAQNRAFLNEFEADYQSLVDAFQQRDKKPQIYLLLPPPSFSADSTLIWNPVIEQDILPKIRATAAELDLPLVDLHTPFLTQLWMFPDSIHPSSLGGTVMAQAVYKAIKGDSVNFAALPVPGAEYRSGAGWTEGNGWWENHEEISSQLQWGPDRDILFIGNSITQGLGGPREIVTHRPGEKAFTEVFADYSWYGAGISGDRTQHVWWRVENGGYENAKPRFVVLTIGVNNFPDDSPEQISAGIDSTVAAIQRKMPEAKLLLQGPLPAGTEPDHPKRQKYEAVHQQLQNTAYPTGVYYVNAGPLFLTESGQLDSRFYAGDGIHLKTPGYEQWARFLLEQIQQIH